jgi:hypothetical protein
MSTSGFIFVLGLDRHSVNRGDSRDEGIVVASGSELFDLCELNFRKRRPQLMKQMMWPFHDHQLHQLAMSGLSPAPGLSFSLLTPATTRFCPRLGTVILKRPEHNDVQVQTPGFLTCTSRGVIPHLSRDHYGLSGICWVHVHFESL